jgi:hypothetical protein
MYFIFIAGNSVAQEKITVLNDALLFSRPDGVVLNSELPQYTTWKDWVNLVDGKIILTVGITNEEELRKMQSYDLSEELERLLEVKQNLGKEDYLNIISQSKPYILIHAYRAEVMGRQFLYKNKVIGEMSCFADIEGSYAPATYGFHFVVVIDNHLVEVAVILNDHEYAMARQLTDYFYYNASDKFYYWKENALEKQKKLFQCLLSEEYMNLPLEFRVLRKGWDMILQTLVIKEYDL